MNESNSTTNFLSNSINYVKESVIFKDSLKGKYLKTREWDFNKFTYKFIDNPKNYSTLKKREFCTNFFLKYELEEFFKEGNVLFNEQKYDDALKYYKRVMNFNANLQEAYLNSGFIYYQMGDDKNKNLGIVTWRRYLKLLDLLSLDCEDKDLMQFYINLILAYLDDEKNGLALFYCNKVIKLNNKMKEKDNIKIKDVKNIKRKLIENSIEEEEDKLEDDELLDNLHILDEKKILEKNASLENNFKNMGQKNTNLNMKENIDQNCSITTINKDTSNSSYTETIVMTKDQKDKKDKKDKGITLFILTNNPKNTPSKKYFCPSVKEIYNITFKDDEFIEKDGVHSSLHESLWNKLKEKPNLSGINLFCENHPVHNIELIPKDCYESLLKNILSSLRVNKKNPFDWDIVFIDNKAESKNKDGVYKFKPIDSSSSFLKKNKNLLEFYFVNNKTISKFFNKKLKKEKKEKKLDIISFINKNKKKLKLFKISGHIFEKNKKLEKNEETEKKSQLKNKKESPKKKRDR